MLYFLYLLAATFLCNAPENHPSKVSPQERAEQLFERSIALEKKQKEKQPAYLRASTLKEVQKEATTSQYGPKVEEAYTKKSWIKPDFESAVLRKEIPNEELAIPEEIKKSFSDLLQNFPELFKKDNKTEIFTCTTITIDLIPFLKSFIDALEKTIDYIMTFPNRDMQEFARRKRFKEIQFIKNNFAPCMQSILDELNFYKEINPTDKNITPLYEKIVTNTRLMGLPLDKKS